MVCFQSNHTSVGPSHGICSCGNQNCFRRATVRLGIDTLIANILVYLVFVNVCLVCQSVSLQQTAYKVIQCVQGPPELLWLCSHWLSVVRHHAAHGVNNWQPDKISSCSYCFSLLHFFFTLCLLWPPCAAYADIIFSSCGFFFFFFSSPNLSGHRVDIYHTSTHGVALARI